MDSQGTQTSAPGQHHDFARSAALLELQVVSMLRCALGDGRMDSVCCFPSVHLNGFGGELQRWNRNENRVSLLDAPTCHLDQQRIVLCK